MDPSLFCSILECASAPMEASAPSPIAPATVDTRLVFRSLMLPTPPAAETTDARGRTEGPESAADGGGAEGASGGGGGGGADGIGVLAMAPVEAEAMPDITLDTALAMYCHLRLSRICEQLIPRPESVMWARR